MEDKLVYFDKSERIERNSLLNNNNSFKLASSDIDWPQMSNFTEKCEYKGSECIC